MTDITENGKYYIPEIEEFHTGFEYESGPRKWDKEIFDIDCFGQTYDQYFGSPLADDIKNGEVRVKHLDHDDIISCCWDHKVTSAGNAFFYYGDNTLNVNYAKHDIIITCYCYGNNVSLFQGRIQNKSELKRLMKQLGIEINQQS